MVYITLHRLRIHCSGWEWNFAEFLKITLLEIENDDSGESESESVASIHPQILSESPHMSLLPFFLTLCIMFKSRATQLSTMLCQPVCPSVGWLVSWSISHTWRFYIFCILLLHCSCPSALVTSNAAPAHPHATGVAVNPALVILTENILQFVVGSFFSWVWKDMVWQKN